MKREPIVLSVKIDGKEIYAPRMVREGFKKEEKKEDPNKFSVKLKQVLSRWIELS